MQTNSTARAIVNKTLLSLGQSPIATDALYATAVVDQFGNVGNAVDKYQQQAVVLLDMFHQALSMTFNKPYLYRPFRFTVVPGQADYHLKGIFIEGFRPNSFFNVSSTTGGNGIVVLPYEQYMEMYARQDNVPTGAPQFICPVPNDNLDQDTCHIRVSPTPDQTYVIEGQCRLIVPPIKNGSDRICFPYRWEHGLIFKLTEVMETKMNEGREGTARVYAEQFIAEIIRDATGAEEETDMIDLGIRLWNGGGRTVRDYNPATDNVPPWP